MFPSVSVPILLTQNSDENYFMDWINGFAGLPDKPTIGNKEDYWRN